MYACVPHTLVHCTLIHTLIRTCLKTRLEAGREAENPVCPDSSKGSEKDTRNQRGETETEKSCRYLEKQAQGSPQPRSKDGCLLPTSSQAHLRHQVGVCSEW